MWKLKAIVAGLALAASTTLAIAQTNPGLTQGQKLTPAQWNNLFASKQDTLGYTPLNTAGGIMTGRLVTAAPGATLAGLNLTPGSAPASPANGDMWATSLGVYAQVNGSTVGPFVSAATASLTIGMPISGGTTTRILRNNAGVLAEYTITGTGTVVAMQTSPSFTTPAIGVATGTSLAIGGCTIGTDLLCVGGANAAFVVNNTSAGSGIKITTATAGSGVTISTTSSTTNEGVALISKGSGGINIGNGTSGVQITLAQQSAVTSTSTQAFAVGAGLTNFAFQVDTNTASAATGIKLTAAAAGGGVAVAAISSGTNENLTIDAKGSGTITLGNASTGAIIHTRATTFSAAITYGGVTLANSVTGTGSMVLGTSPSIAGGALSGTFSGTPAFSGANFITFSNLAQVSGYTLFGNTTGSNANLAAFTIGGLTQKASPAATDLVLIQDQAASGQLKYALVSSVGSAGSVSSIAGNTGAFTLSNGLTNSTNDIRLASIATGRMLANTSGGSTFPSATKLPYIARASATFVTDATSSTETVYNVTLTAPGGGGGGANGTAAYGGGGGAGGTCRGTFTGVAPGTTVTITLPSGGAGGAGAGGSSGSSASNATIAATGITTITATGGTGGGGGGSPTGQIAGGGAGGTCSTTSGTNIVFTAVPGATGGPGVANAGGAGQLGGQGGGSFWGGGAPSPNNGLGTCLGNASTTPGGGGSGACIGSGNGGNGGAATAEVTWASVQ